MEEEFEEKPKKKSFWNNKRTVKGKALSAWVIVMILIFMLFTFGIGIFLGKEVFWSNNNNKNSNKNNDQENVVNNGNKENDVPTTKDENVHTSFTEKNGENEITYSQAVYDSNFGLSLYLLSDQKSVRINIESYAIKNIYQLNIDDFSKVINFDKKVLQILFGGFGQAVGAEYIFFLMEDGTIEYIPFYGELNKWSSLSNDEKMNSHGAINGVTDVIGLYRLSIDNEFSGYFSVGATRKDGSFYNLFEFFKN